MSAERTILVGGGGFCRELIWNGRDCTDAGTLPPITGYIDDTGPTLEQFGYDLPWLGRIEDYQPRPGDGFVLAVGSPAAKRAVHEKLAPRGARFNTFVHPSSRICPNATYGEGLLVAPLNTIGPNVRIANFVTINAGSGMGHDSSIGDFSTLSARVDITGGIRVGSDVMVGSSAVFVPRISIGDGATIGAGALVYRSVKPGATLFSQPAKLLKTRA